MTNKIKIYYFAYGLITTPSVRHRGKFLLDHFKNCYGFEYELFHPGFNRVNLLKILKALGEIFFLNFLFRKKFIIFCQKISSRNKYAFLIKLILIFNRRKSIYDLDDAMYELRDKKTVNEFIKKTKVVLVGSHSLLQYAKRLNKNAYLITTPVIQHSIKKKKRNKKFNVGWVGIFKVHRENLFEILFPILKQLDFPFRFSLLGIRNQEDLETVISYFKNNRNIELYTPLNLDWVNEISILEEIKNFDLGTSPLKDNEINKAKSAFKAKQYLSCGVPVLGSVVGENNYIIKDGINGFLCRDKSDFKKYIEYFYRLPQEKYFSFINRARASYLNFRIDKIAREILILLRELIIYHELDI